MQKTVELIIRHYVGANGNVRDLPPEQLREIENAAQVDRWEIEAKETNEESMQ